MESKFNLDDIIAEKKQFGKVNVHEVKTIDDFDNAMDELADLDNADSQAQSRFDAKVKPWQEFLDGELRKNESRREFLQREAYAFVLDHNDDHSLKSARMGVTVRHNGASAKVANKSMLLEYAKQNDLKDLITTTETVDTSKLKKQVGLQVIGDKAVDDDGQVVPGYEVTPAHVSVSFAPTKESK